MPSEPNPIASNIDYVRRAQRTISSAPAVRDLGMYLERPTFIEVAQFLGKKYFPKTWRQNLDVVMEQLVNLYRCALTLYPIYQTKLPGTYRANWTRGVLLSWFRRSVNKNTRQWYFAYQRFNDGIDLEQTNKNALDICRIKDAPWIEEWVPWLHDMSDDKGLKSDLARQIYLPLALAHNDAEMRSISDFAATPNQRSKNRVKKIGSIGYLRKGRDIWMLADRYMLKTLGNEFDFIDLREKNIELLDYTLTYIENNPESGRSGLQIKIKQEMLSDAIADIKIIIASTASPQYKIIKINRVLADFGARHQYATGSGKELWELDSRARKMVMDHIQPVWPEAKARFHSITNVIYKDLVFPVNNPFFGDISEETWLSIWSPWR